MKNWEKMTKKEFAVFILLAISSGMIIGISGAASLLANNLYGVWGRLVGACLFTLGMYVIVVYEMRLFTGMVSAIPKMGVKNTWRLPAAFFANIVDVAIVAVLIYFSPVADKVLPQAKTLAQGKLDAKLWGLSALCSSILCGVLITLSVWSVDHAPKKSLSATLGVIFPIAVFAFCGFDHCIANTLYFYYLGEISWRVVGYILLCVLGNLLGGVILPFISLLKEHSKKEKEN